MTGKEIGVMPWRRTQPDTADWTTASRLEKQKDQGVDSPLEPLERTAAPADTLISAHATNFRFGLQNY